MNETSLMSIDYRGIIERLKGDYTARASTGHIAQAVYTTWEKVLVLRV